MLPAAECPSDVLTFFGFDGGAGEAVVVLARHDATYGRGLVSLRPGRITSGGGHRDAWVCRDAELRANGEVRAGWG